MRGIILAGGTGSRLYPLTTALSKQLLAVYDKPLIYYPLATLMLAGIRDILIITTPQDQPLFHTLLGEGHDWGITLSYAQQSEPRGVADALLVARTFLSGDRCALILGDNIFFGHGLHALLNTAVRRERGATIFGYWVPDPERFGVVEFDGKGAVASIEEKPAQPRSHYAITGLYFYDGQAPDFAAELQPSRRNELEITDLNRRYLDVGELHASRLERGFAWLDAGTPDALLDAANYIGTIERRQGLKIACVEEIAWRSGWIDDAAVDSLAERAGANGYGDYLRAILEQGR